MYENVHNLSFILLGNDDRINLREVQDLSLQNVNLVVIEYLLNRCIQTR